MLMDLSDSAKIACRIMRSWNHKLVMAVDGWPYHKVRFRQLKKCGVTQQATGRESVKRSFQTDAN